MREMGGEERGGGGVVMEMRRGVRDGRGECGGGVGGVCVGLLLFCVCVVFCLWMVWGGGVFCVLVVCGLLVCGWKELRNNIGYIILEYIERKNI
jgi:hypothetical protein